MCIEKESSEHAKTVVILYYFWESHLKVSEKVTRKSTWMPIQDNPKKKENTFNFLDKKFVTTMIHIHYGYTKFQVY